MSSAIGDSNVVHVVLHEYPILSDATGHRRVIWNDELFWGPLRGDLPLLELRKLRREYLDSVSRSLYAPVDPVLLERFERLRALKPPRPELEGAIDELVAADEVVLWFGEGRAQQLALLQCVALLNGRENIVSAAAFANPVRLRTEGEILRLFDGRLRITQGERSNMGELWRLFCLESPVLFHRAIAAGSGVSLELREAARRICGLFPSVEDGLNDVQRSLLRGLAEGPKDAVELVVDVLEDHDRGDVWVWHTLMTELSGAVPLIECRRPIRGSTIAAIRREELFLSVEGQSVLRGELDAIELNGIDRWVGGCHLDAAAGWVYRWSAGQEAFVSPTGDLEVLVAG